MPNAEGNGGNIQINTARLSLSDEALVSANILGTGDAGDLTINATDLIAISDSTIQADIFPLASGEGGSIEINTANLNLTDGGFISASIFGAGNAGNITLNATDTIAGSKNSIVLANVLPGGIGNGGSININATNLSLTDNTIFVASSASQGNAGNIEIATMGTVLLDNSLINSNIGDRDRIAAEGKVGNILIEAKEIIFTNRGQIQAGLFSAATGEPGIVSLNATESIAFTGENTGIFSNNDPGSFGDASNTQLSAPTITLDGGAVVEASNLGRGNGGNVMITANKLTLDRNNQISGSTVSGTGGLVNLQIAKDLILRSGNTISAQAINDANGGNLTINTELIIAFPNGNNDLVASAVEGQGGNIDITAESIFGIQERPLNPFTNDINASSEFGLQGNITINTPNVDPTSGLINLPASVGDASDQISQNPCQQGVGSEFILAGKGGLPPDVSESLNSEKTRVDLIEPLPSKSRGTALKDTAIPQGYNVRSESFRASHREQRSGGEIKPTDNLSTELVPAMGWVFNDKGEVTLTAYSTFGNEIQRSGKQDRRACKSEISP